MPSREIILEHVESLDSHCWAQDPDPEANQVWSGKEHGASFTLIKDYSNILGKDRVCLTLALKGKKPGKDKLGQAFIAALGKPIISVPARRLRDPQLILWNITT